MATDLDLFSDYLPSVPAEARAACLREVELLDSIVEEEPEVMQPSTMEPASPVTADVIPTIGSALYGVNLFGDSAEPIPEGPLSQRFTFPPFSVLNAREGDWQARKRAWIGLGIQSEVGRSDNLLNMSDSIVSLRNIDAKRDNGYEQQSSIFDPVLCELCYRWFCPPGGQIVDPFAGGSVRGIVAGLLGFRYFGIDLRAEQIVANVEQRDRIIGPVLPGFEEEGQLVRWACGDARALMSEAPEADAIMACPPYGDLERYSDNPLDLSAMNHADFMAAYGEIVHACAAKLKMDRLACFVVGDFRDKKTGYYRGFVADTINLFRDAGMHLYNDMILVTAVGSLPVRLSGQFEKSRKVGKTHQNVLCFAKGDPRKAFVKD